MLAITDLILLQQLSKNYLHFVFYCVFQDLLPPLAISFTITADNRPVCFLLQRTVSCYANKSTPMFAAFLDASKAFIRAKHRLLFAKLIKRNTLMCWKNSLRAMYLCAWASAGVAKQAFAPWKFGLRSKKLLKTQNKQFIPISWVNSCNDSLPMWHSHCTRVSSLFWYNAVMKYSSLNPLLWLQMQAAKLASELL